MKILFIGNFCVNYTTEYHHKRTYEKLGHDVETLQENQTSVSEVLSYADKIDLLVWTHTHDFRIKEDVMPVKDMLSIFKKKNIPSVGYHLDLWLGLERQKDLEDDQYWNIEYFFCTDKLMVNWLNEKPNMPKTFYLPAGVFEDECYLGQKKEEFKHDVIFVGSKGYHHEWSYRSKLVNWLQETYGPRFAHYGGDGKKVVRGDELNNLYASAKVVVGDTLCKEFTYPYYFSDRLFETTGRGGFMIFPYIKGLEDNFVLNYPLNRKEDKDKQVELVTYDFNDFNDLKNKIDFFIEIEGIREEIRRAGFERTKKEHTYTNRIKKLIKIIKNEKNLL